MGKALARETAKRFLLTSLLVGYANRRFGLADSGQKAMIYFAPHPPLRQKALNNIIPDSFYRDLYMSPCLSGWQQGEQKHRYMHLCHQVLSRSQINAVAKLREAGIITNNLVVLPPLSNTSLANNGTHISLGSRRLGALLKDRTSGFDARHEKLIGDLVIKVAEHFLPLFVGTYSAAPYRLGFSDFHPETALGFLPHELDYTHLRMLWRRWRKKASLSLFGRSVTPFGPSWLDHGFSRLCNLKGDFVPDFRLLDYPVCFLSTNRSPALNGHLGNQERLKEDLANMGISDQQMSLYQFLKPREFATMGFSGVEGRHYSVFENFGRDLGNATSIQGLIVALAYKLIATGRITHADIPDDPALESERRQIFFGAAIDLPTFFVHQNSGNRFLQRILAKTKRTRSSRRYPGYQRVYNIDYRHALIDVLQDEAPDLVASLNQGYNLEDLKLRLDFPGECSASGKLTRGIMARLNTSSPMNVPAAQFNQAAEDHYRETLKQAHLAEALEYLERDLQRLDQAACLGDKAMLEALKYNLNGQSASNFLKNIKRDLLAEELDIETLQRLINLLIFSIHRDQARAARALQPPGRKMSHPHQYIERDSGQVRTETLFGDQLIKTIYAPVREHANWLFKALTGARASQALGLLNFDRSLGTRISGNRTFLDACGIDFAECLDPPETLDTARKVFERKIRYWQCRPMPADHSAIVSPADARLLIGSFSETSQLFIKEKFFSFEELLGEDKATWLAAFNAGDFAVLRLTADKYHYNHVPVSGRVDRHLRRRGALPFMQPAGGRRNGYALLQEQARRHRHRHRRSGWHGCRLGRHDRDRGHDDRPHRAMLQHAPVRRPGAGHHRSLPAQGATEKPLPAGQQHRYPDFSA